MLIDIDNCLVIVLQHFITGFIHSVSWLIGSMSASLQSPATDDFDKVCLPALQRNRMKQPAMLRRSGFRRV
jgi:hypothetical protein